MTDSIFQRISTKGVFRYDLRITSGELLGQLELRQAHQGSHTGTLAAVPPTEVAIVKRTNGRDKPAAWTTNPLEKYSAPQASTPNQLSSGLLASHSEEIKNIQATIKGLDEKLQQHEVLFRDFATKSDLEAMFKRFLPQA